MFFKKAPILLSPAVTLRLLGLDGVVVSQSDGFPMGPLLPPTAWDAGDSKPGYMVLEVSVDRSLIILKPSAAGLFF